MRRALGRAPPAPGSWVERASGEVAGPRRLMTPPASPAGVQTWSLAASLQARCIAALACSALFL
eukprot:15101144-Alexandrium_andersonii.AAC.1